MVDAQTIAAGTLDTIISDGAAVIAVFETDEKWHNVELKQTAGGWKIELCKPLAGL